jgi:hypothetical protein
VRQDNVRRAGERAPPPRPPRHRPGGGARSARTVKTSHTPTPVTSPAMAGVPARRQRATMARSRSGARSGTGRADRKGCRTCPRPAAARPGHGRSGARCQRQRGGLCRWPRGERCCGRCPCPAIMCRQPCSRFDACLALHVCAVLWPIPAAIAAHGRAVSGLAPSLGVTVMGLTQLGELGVLASHSGCHDIVVHAAIRAVACGQTPSLAFRPVPGCGRLLPRSPDRPGSLVRRGLPGTG